MKKTLIIPPSGKRKSKIIIKSTFQGKASNSKELNDSVALLLGKFGVFE